MQHRGCPEQLASLTIVMVHHAMGVVVEAEGMKSDALSAALIHGEALHLMDHRALTDAALEAETVLEQTVTQHPVDDQSFTEGPLAQRELVHPEHLHGGLQDQRARNDDLGAAIVDRGELPALFRRHRHQLLDNTIEALTGHPVPVQLQRRSIVLTGGQRTDRHGRAAGGDQHRNLARFDPAVHLVHRRLEGSLNERLEERASLGWNRIVLDEIPLQSDGPHPGAGERAGITSIREDQFGGAAADVEQQMRTIAERHA